jgi:thiamine pyrophosphate-dependent acetolactate synthase large subunit-like protein
MVTDYLQQLGQKLQNRIRWYSVNCDGIFQIVSMIGYNGQTSAGIKIILFNNKRLGMLENSKETLWGKVLSS